MNEEYQPSIFDDLNDPVAVRRKYLVPKWIRFFCWLFAIFCPAAIVSAVSFAVAGRSSALSLYGIQTSDLFSVAGVTGVFVFGIKGTAAIGILAEKDWAMKGAIVDAILGIALCIFQMIFNPWVTTTSFNHFTATNFNMRLELLLLIPYLIKMINIRQQWEENRYARNATSR